MRCTTAILTFALLAAAGCTVGPDYAPPPPDSPEAWPEPLEGGLSAHDADLREWWRAFGDPTLDGLVDRALAGSLDLREAAARVREARALRGVTASEGLPEIDAVGGASVRHDSENTFAGGFPAVSEDEIELYDVGFDATWEIDLFGRVRRSVEAADAELDAAFELERDARVLLVSEVARNYAEFRSAQARLALAFQNVGIQEDTLEISRDRFEAGISTELQVAQARAQLETTRSRIPLLQMDLKRAAFRLDVLLGLQPGTLLPEIEAPAPVPGAPDAVAIGLPAELLRRRPDIRRAERSLAAATARIGAATAELYPQFTLDGFFGLQSAETDTLFESESRAWTVGPLAVRWPIFNGGRLRSAIRVEEARQEVALVQYERAVLEAYEEVANALVSYARILERRESLALAVEADQLAVDLANDLWSRGLTDFLNVIDTQRALFLLQDELAVSDAQVTTSLIALYKALGGGWDEASLRARGVAAAASPDAAGSGAPAAAD